MPAGNSFAPESASAALSVAHAAPPCHTNRYTRFVAPPLAHTVSRQPPPARASPSHAAGSLARHTTCALTGSIRISAQVVWRSEEHTSELQSQSNLVCRLLLE